MFRKYAEIQSKDFAEGVDQLKSGDFNGDGNSDLVITRIGQNIGEQPVPLQLFLGDGNGKFKDVTEAIFDKTPWVYFTARMIIADFNNDRIADIFCIESGMDKPPFPGGQNQLFLSASGKLINSTSWLPQEKKFNHGASVGDVNHDGNIDILNNATSRSDLLINTQSQFKYSADMMPYLVAPNIWQPGTLTTQGHTWSALIDVNNDTYVDMILGNWLPSANSPKTPEIYLNDKTGNFSKSVAIQIPNSILNQQTVLDIKAINLNDDDKADLVLAVTDGENPGYKRAYLQFLENLGNGTFVDVTAQRFISARQTATDTGWYKSIEVVDIDNDGFHDLVLDATGGKASVLKNDGSGRFTEIFTTEYNMRITTADVNNDGLIDLITQKLPSVFQVYLNEYSNKHIYAARFDGDTVFGSNKSDRFINGNGNDYFNGRDDVDFLEYKGISSEYRIEKNNLLSIKNRNSLVKDEAEDIERLRFSDKTVALDIDGNAGQAYRLYQAALDRTPDDRGLAGWINYMDNSGQLNAMAQMFIDSQEFRVKYGALDNFNFVNQLYLNVLDRNGEATGVNAWVGALNSGALSRAQVLVGFSESNENKANVIGQIKDGIPYVEYWLT